MANATDIERLIVSLEARTKEYEKALAKAQGVTVTRLRSMEREAQSFASRFDAKMGAIGVNIKAALGAAAIAAVASFGVAARNAVRDAAAIGDLADKVGLTTDAIQELSYGAVQADLSFDDLSGGLTKFSKALGEAQNGQGGLLKLLQANGYDQAAVKSLKMADALAVVADLVKNARNEQDQMLIVTEAFGRGGAQMIEFLKNGSAGLKTFSQDATDAGAKINEHLIRKAQELDDKWAALMQSMRVKTQATVLAIIDELSKIGGSEGLNPGQLAGRTYGQMAIPGYKAPIRGVGSAGFSFTPALPKGPETVIPDEAAARRSAELAEAAARSAREKAEAITRVVTALHFEYEQLQKSELQQEIDAKLREAGVSAASKQGQEISAYVTRIYEQTEAEKKAAEALDSRIDIEREMLQNRIEMAEEASARFTEMQEEQRAGWMSLAELGVSAVERIALGGEKLTDVLADVAKSLASAALQASLLGQGPLAGLFGTSGSGGFFGSLISGFMDGGVPAGIYHKGGVVGAGGPSRNVSPAMFRGASRYHSGGIAGLRSGEVPAILQKGEMVLPRGARGGGTSIQIVNQTSTPMTGNTMSDDGMGQIRFLIKDVVRKEVPGQVRQALPAMGYPAMKTAR